MKRDDKNSRTPRAAVLAAVLAFLLASIFTAPGWAQDEVAYTFKVEGVKDDQARALFADVSLLRQLKKTPPRSLAELRDRIRRDVQSLGKILQSRGYYNSRVSYRVDRSAGADIKIVIRADEGERYRWIKAETRAADQAAAADLAAVAADLMPALPRPMKAAAILDYERALLSRLPEIGYPYAKTLKRDVVVDHADGTVSLTLEIEAGPKIHFGDITFDGLATVKAKYLQRLIPWRTGDVYNARLMDEYRLALAKTNLFSAVNVALAGEDGGIIVNAREALQRSYGFGAGYSTGEGFDGTAFWEHRNFFGNGERFRVAGTGGEIEQSVTTSLDIPAFRRRDQKLLTDFTLKREKPDAYTSYSVTAGAALERPFLDHWTMVFGGSLEYANIADAEGTRNFYLVGGRGLLRRDDTDSLLDPTRGSRFSTSVRPYVGQQSGFLQFTIVETTGSFYAALDTAARYVIAGRAKVGMVFGAELDTLPADKRFYAGGGNSVRGYQYQLAGPLDAANDPTGGRSVVEGGLEARIKVTDRIGVVPFVEAAEVDADALPDFSEKIYVGAGLGLRYYTSFAPVRLDVAFPLTKRAVDHTFEIYISLGQSF